MPENQARPGELLDGKQIKLLSEHAVVALLGFFLLLEEVVEIFLGIKRGPVDALKLRVLLVAQPVRAGDIEQLECLDLPRGRNVRAAAEVGEFAGAVDRNLFIGLGELLDEMALHEIAFFFELVESLLARQKFPRVRQVLLHQLLHLLFELLQVVRSKRRWAIEVVEESALGRGAVAELGFGEKLEHGCGKQDGPTSAGRLPATRDLFR